MGAAEADGLEADAVGEEVGVGVPTAGFAVDETVDGAAPPASAGPAHPVRTTADARVSALITVFKFPPRDIDQLEPYYNELSREGQDAAGGCQDFGFALEPKVPFCGDPVVGDRVLCG